MDQATGTADGSDERRRTSTALRRVRLLRFAGHWGMELLVVSVGVLVALWAQQWAEDRSWRDKAAVSNRAMNLELARAAGVFDERALVQPCLDKRLEELDRLVRAARLSGSLPDIRKVPMPPARPLAVAAWEDAVASGTLSRLDQKRRFMLSVNYPLIRDYPRYQTEEAALWATLRIIEAVPGRASDEMLTQAAMAIAKLRWGSRILGITASQTRDDIIASGITPSYFLLFDREGTRAQVMSSVRTRSVCRPLAVGGRAEPPLRRLAARGPAKR